MRRVFIDTVGFLALWNARDQGHSAATEVFEKLTAEGVDFYTTEYVLLECGNAAARTPFRNDVIEVRREFVADGKVIVPTDVDCAAAWNAYARKEAAEAGIVDHVSFIVMRRLGITEVFGNDRHFQAAGFVTLF
jgi:predicted nucleic acid-binding protein